MRECQRSDDSARVYTVISETRSENKERRNGNHAKYVTESVTQRKSIPAFLGKTEDIFDILVVEVRWHTITTGYRSIAVAQRHDRNRGTTPIDFQSFNPSLSHNQKAKLYNQTKENETK